MLIYRQLYYKKGHTKIYRFLKYLTPCVRFYYNKIRLICLQWLLSYQANCMRYSIVVVFEKHLLTQLVKQAIKSALSAALGSPEKAIAFPGANPAGDFNHLSKLAFDHFIVALADKAEEYEKPAPAAMFIPTIPPRAGPVEWAYTDKVNNKNS